MKKLALMLAIVLGCVFGTKAFAWGYYYYPYTTPVVYTQPVYYYQTTPVAYTTPYYGGYYYRPYYGGYYHYYRPCYWGW